MSDQSLPANLTTASRYSAPDIRTYSGAEGDYQDVGLVSGLSDATFGVSFRAAELPGERVLFSMDGDGRQAGDFTVWLRDGIVYVAQDDTGRSEWLKVPDLVILPDQTHHLAVSFGDLGIQVWLDGELVAAEPDFKVDLAGNDRVFVVGATRAWRDDQSDPAHHRFEGEIGHVRVFDGQIGAADAQILAAEASAQIGNAAARAQAEAALAPVLEQMHHGSEMLSELVSDVLAGGSMGAMGSMGSMMMGSMMMGGHDHHAPGLSHLALQMGNMRGNRLEGTDGADGLNGGFNNDRLIGLAGNDVLQGDYGHDKLWGGAGHDMLDGGAGNDQLFGGAGDDLLISRSDAREPDPADIPGRDEGDPLGELTNGKVHGDQPIPGNDLMVGGAGADVFYFQTLINAKERYIEKHTRDDGTINWHGVAGENDALHDHWVDMIGDDVIRDFSRAEGDRIVIEGHTTYIDTIRYGDRNGDGVMDHSVITLYSDQGRNGGAHHLDQLGTVTVYGDLVKASDIYIDAGPAYGIVNTIDALEEALTPARIAPQTGPINPQAQLPGDIDPGLSLGAPVLALPGSQMFSGAEGDYQDVGLVSGLSDATFGVSFRAAELPGERVLFSMDGDGRQAGDFTVWLRDGIVYVAQDDTGRSEWLKVPDLVILPDQTHHLAVSFGDLGIQVWLDGELVAAEPDFKVDLAGNDRVFVVGATRAWRDDQSDPAHHRFEGEIGHVRVFDGQIGAADAQILAAEASAQIGNAAARAQAEAALAPVLEQMHHGSEMLSELVSDVLAGGSMGAMGSMGSMMMGSMMMGGHDHHAPGLSHLALQMGNMRGNRLEGTDGADGLNGGFNNDRLIGLAGNDVLQGDYGHDKLWGGAGHDMLDGGAGNDQLFGGAGDDLLISRSDAREPDPADIPGRDEGDPLGELTNGKVHGDQPIPGNDLMVGGAGADVFYFQTLINAKERYIEKHTRDDGTINWHGVAGENDALHDHWVDMIGDDVIRDFSRAEGDRIVIEGHTTYIDTIRYGDRNGDGVMDHSVITLYSDQGRNGGAHHLDQLGTVTVYGDLVKASDIYIDAGPAYGIVNTIDALEEALTPARIAPQTGPINPQAQLPGKTLAANGAEAVFSLPGTFTFAPDERAPLIVEHRADMAVQSGTFAMSFTAHSLPDWSALFSKDASGSGLGHIAAYMNHEGNLYLRVQESEKSHYYTLEDVIEVGTAYDLTVSYGGRGIQLSLNGATLIHDLENRVSVQSNTEALVVGATGWSSTPGTTDRVHTHFDGVISDFAMYQGTLNGKQVFGSEARADVLTLASNANAFDFVEANDGSLILVQGARRIEVSEDTRFLDFNDIDVHVSTIDTGTSGSDSVRGSQQSDILSGGSGNDTLIGNDHRDLLIGGNGNDKLYGGDHHDTLRAGAGDDTLDGGAQSDILYGGAGHDELRGDDGWDHLYGGLGDDVLFGRSWSDAGADGDIDRAYFNGNRADYSIEVDEYYNGSRGADAIRLIVTDTASGGRDGYYEGRDVLYDLDRLVFADGEVAVSDLL